MRQSVKGKLAKMSNGNMELNRKALQLKRSWEEVAGILKVSNRNNKKSK